MRSSSASLLVAVVSFLVLGCALASDPDEGAAEFAEANRRAKAHYDRAPEYLPEAAARSADVFLAAAKACHRAIEDHQLVVTLNEQGEIVEAFVSPSTRGTRCIAEQVRGAVLPDPPFAPFYL